MIGLGVQRRVKVRLGKSDYTIPYETVPNGRLVRITSHPLNPEKLLLWRERRDTDKVSKGTAFYFMHTGARGAPEDYEKVQERSLFVTEAEKTRGGVLAEGIDVANLACMVFKDGNASVWDFMVNPRYRRRTVGAALRESTIQHLKSSGVGKIFFPPHAEEGFYLKRGLRKEFSGGGSLLRYAGDLRELGVKPAGIKLKVLWQRSRPRFA